MLIWLVLVVGQVGPIPPMNPDSPLAVEARTTEGRSAVPAPSPPPNGLAELEQWALRANPTLAQAGASIEAADARADQAGLYPNPQLVYDPDQVGINGTAGDQTGFIHIPVVTAGKVRVNRDRYEQEVVEVRWNALAQRYRVLNGVRLRFYEVLARDRIVAVRVEVARLADEIARVTEQMVEAGHASRPDLLVARNQARLRLLNVTKARSQRFQAWHDLVTFVGVPHLAPAPLRGQLDHASPELSWDQFKARLLHESPELQAAYARFRRTQIELRQERIEPIPDFRLRLGAGYDQSTQQTLPVTRLYMDFPLWDRNQGNIRRAQADLARARQEIDRVALSLQNRLAAAFARRQAHQETVRTYGDQVLPDAQEALQLYREAFQRREASASRVQSALSDYADASEAYVNALLALRRTDVEIQGLLLTDGLDEPPGPPSSGRPSRVSTP